MIKLTGNLKKYLLQLVPVVLNQKLYMIQDNSDDFSLQPSQPTAYGLNKAILQVPIIYCFNAFGSHIFLASGSYHPVAA